MDICGAILKIKRLANETFSARFGRLPEAVELVRGLTDGRFVLTREVDAAEEKSATLCVAEEGVGSMDVVVRDRLTRDGRTAWWVGHVDDKHASSGRPKVG